MIYIYIYIYMEMTGRREFSSRGYAWEDVSLKQFHHVDEDCTMREW